MQSVIPKREREAVLKLRRNGNQVIFPLRTALLRMLGWKNGDMIAAKVESGMLRAVKIEIGSLFPEGDK